MKFFLNLDFFIIENVTAEDEMQDIINLEEIIYLGQKLQTMLTEHGIQMIGCISEIQVVRPHNQYG